MSKATVIEGWVKKAPLHHDQPKLKIRYLAVFENGTLSWYSNEKKKDKVKSISLAGYILVPIESYPLGVVKPFLANLVSAHAVVLRQGDTGAKSEIRNYLLDFKDEETRKLWTDGLTKGGCGLL